MSDGGFHLFIQQLDIKVLWITGQEAAAQSLLQDCPGLMVTMVNSMADAVTFLEADDFDAILATLPLLDGCIETLLDEANGSGSRTPVIVHAPLATLADAVRLTKLGAYHVLHDEGAAPSVLHAAANTK